MRPLVSRSRAASLRSGPCQSRCDGLLDCRCPRLEDSLFLQVCYFETGDVHCRCNQIGRVRSRRPGWLRYVATRQDSGFLRSLPAPHASDDDGTERATLRPDCLRTPNLESSRTERKFVIAVAAIRSLDSVASSINDFWYQTLSKSSVIHCRASGASTSFCNALQAWAHPAQRCGRSGSRRWSADPVARHFATDARRQEGRPA